VNVVKYLQSSNHPHKHFYLHFLRTLYKKSKKDKQRKIQFLVKMETLEDALIAMAELHN
jgi:hypothetical protein